MKQRHTKSSLKNEYTKLRSRNNYYKTPLQSWWVLLALHNSNYIMRGGQIYPHFCLFRIISILSKYPLHYKHWFSTVIAANHTVDYDYHPSGLDLYHQLNLQIDYFGNNMEGQLHHYYHLNPCSYLWLLFITQIKHFNKKNNIILIMKFVFLSNNKKNYNPDRKSVV